jgi:hypothetical protein
VKHVYREPLTRVNWVYYNILIKKQEPVYETIPNVDQRFYQDVATNANESEDISAKGQ